MEMYQKINKLLKAKGLKKKDMCQCLGIPYNSLMSMFHRQSKNIALSTVQSIAGYLDVSIDYLIRDDITDIHYGKLHTDQTDVEQDQDKKITIVDQDEIEIIKKFQRLSLKNKYKIEGIIEAYLQEQNHLEVATELTFSKSVV